MKFIEWDTTKNCITSFTISISCCKGCLIPSRFGSLPSSLTIFNRIPYALINRAQKCTYTHFPKGVITPIKEGRCI